jgi:hypothetical protein
MMAATRATATARKTPAVRYERRRSDTWREPSDRVHEGPKEPPTCIYRVT